MSLCTLVEMRHAEADLIGANLTEFTTLLLRYLRTSHPVIADELCDRFGFRCMPPCDENMVRYAVVGDTTYLIGGRSRRFNIPMRMHIEGKDNN